MKEWLFWFLDDIVNKYNNTVHRTIKAKLIDVTSDFYVEYNEDSNKKDLKMKTLKLVIMSKYWNTKTFLLQDILKIGQKKFLLLAKLKIQFHGLISDLNGEPIAGRVLIKKNCKKLVRKNTE